MEIAYVGPVPPLTGGISQHGARLTEALTAMGHTVHVYSWASQYPRFLYAGPQTGPGARQSGALFELRWWDPISWWRAGRRARSSDLLVFPWVTPATAPAYRAMMAAASPTPSVAVVHNLKPHESRPGDAALTRWILRRLRGALLHAATDAETLAGWVPDLRVAVVPHPPNLEIERTPAPAPPPYKLLFFGHVRAYKGLDIALEAVRILVERGAPIELTVAGHFWEPLDRWHERIETAGLRHLVDMRPGYVADAEVAALFGSHHVVVAPYRSASQSGIVPLARSAGRLVVATKVGGLAEGFTEGTDGELAPPDDPSAFADAIQRAVKRVGDEPSSPPTTSWERVAEGIVELGR
ncbi:MAG TPA: glycosyltransferase [Actinomycetota bacterium]|nr:glycosyltransferase [Actinomycetota bacterium]